MHSFRSFQFQDVFALDSENGAKDTPTLIDQMVIFPPIQSSCSSYLITHTNLGFTSPLM